jgi:hypothetical protein
MHHVYLTLTKNWHSMHKARDRSKYLYFWCYFILHISFDINHHEVSFPNRVFLIDMICRGNVDCRLIVMCIKWCTKYHPKSVSQIHIYYINRYVICNRGPSVRQYFYPLSIILLYHLRSFDCECRGTCRLLLPVHTNLYVVYSSYFFVQSAFGGSVSNCPV